MQYWGLAGGLILALALVEHRRTTKPFVWQLRFAVLVAANLTVAACCHLQKLPILNTACLFFLINSLYILAADDIQTQHMQTVHLYLLILGGAVTAFVNGEGWIGRFLLFLMLVVVLHLMARRPQSGIGSGDAKVIAALALYFGFSQLFSVLFFALTAGLLFGLAMILFQKATVKTALPFLPFLLVGTLMGIWI